VVPPLAEAVPPEPEPLAEPEPEPEPEPDLMQMEPARVAPLHQPIEQHLILADGLDDNAVNPQHLVGGEPEPQLAEQPLPEPEPETETEPLPEPLPEPEPELVQMNSARAAPAHQPIEEHLILADGLDGNSIKPLVGREPGPQSEPKLVLQRMTVAGVDVWYPKVRARTVLNDIVSCCGKLGLQEGAGDHLRDGSAVKLIQVSGDLSGTYVRVLVPEAYPDEPPIVVEPPGLMLNSPPGANLLRVCEALKAEIAASRR
jgi:hypothetical protein